MRTGTGTVWWKWISMIRNEGAKLRAYGTRTWPDKKVLRGILQTQGMYKIVKNGEEGPHFLIVIGNVMQITIYAIWRML